MFTGITNDAKLCTGDHGPWGLGLRFGSPILELVSGNRVLVLQVWISVMGLESLDLISGTLGIPFLEVRFWISAPKLCLSSLSARKGQALDGYTKLYYTIYVRCSFIVLCRMRLTFGLVCSDI